MTDKRIVAVGLLTKRDLSLLGPAFNKAWPLEESSSFSHLLQAIDDADREIRRERSAVGSRPRQR